MPKPVPERQVFVADTVCEFQVTYREASELEDFRRGQYENFGTLFAAILPKLKQLVEAH